MDSGDLLLREIAVCKKSTLTKARIERSDWRTAQVVDEAMDRLATGALHDEAASFLRDKMVSPAVMLAPVTARRPASRARCGLAGAG